MAIHLSIVRVQALPHMVDLVAQFTLVIILETIMTIYVKLRMVPIQIQ